MRRLTVGLAALVTFLALVGAGPGSLEVTAQVLYSTDFSQDPNWTTDDPGKLKWAPATGTFHGTQINTEGTYAYKHLAGFNPNQWWTLEYDAKINSCGWSAGLTIGLFDSSLWYFPAALNDKSVVDGGPVVGLYGPQSSISTYSPDWATGVWYHHVMEFDPATDKLGLRIADLSSGLELWNLSVDAPSFSPDLTYLGVTRVFIKNTGPGADPWATVDYNLDNFVLRQVPEPSSLTMLWLLGASGVAVGWWRRRKRGMQVTCP